MKRSCLSSSMLIIYDAFEFIALSEETFVAACKVLKDYSGSKDDCNSYAEQTHLRNGRVAQSDEVGKMESLKLPYPLTREPFGVGRRL